MPAPYNPELRVTPVDGNQLRFCSTFLPLPVLTAVRRMPDVAIVAHDPNLRSVTCKQSMQVMGYTSRLRLLLLVFRTTGQRKPDNAHKTNLVRHAGQLVLSKILQSVCPLLRMFSIADLVLSQ